MPRTAKEISTQIELQFLADMHLIPSETFASIAGLSPESERVMQSRGTLPPCLKIASRRYYREDDAVAYIKRAMVTVDNTGRPAKSAVKKAAEQAAQDILK